MPTISVGYHPELTLEDAVERLAIHFADKYNVYKPDGLEALWNGKAHLLIRRDRWSSVALWLLQTENATQVRFKLTWPPAALAGLLLVAAVSLFVFQTVLAIILMAAAIFAVWSLLRRNGRPLEEDIRLVVTERVLLGKKYH